MTWRVIILDEYSAPYNMALDEALFESHETGTDREATLRFYRWENPTLSLGYAQSYEKAVEEDFCRREGIDVVRRPTGGRAVLHDFELTYSVSAEYGNIFSEDELIENYTLISRALLKGFKNIDLELTMKEGRGTSPDPGSASPCFVSGTRAENICYKNKKVIGSSQRRGAGAFLQHGSIPLEMNYDTLAGATGFESETLKRIIAPVNSLLEEPLTPEELSSCLVSGFREFFGDEFERVSAPTRSEKRRAEELSRKKYGTGEWNRDGRFQPGK